MHKSRHGVDAGGFVVPEPQESIHEKKKAAQRCHGRRLWSTLPRTLSPRVGQSNDTSFIDLELGTFFSLNG